MAADDENLIPYLNLPPGRRAYRNRHLPASRAWNPHVSIFPREYVHTITDSLIFQERVRLSGPSLTSGLYNGYPLTFARAPDGNVHIASGLGSVIKWDGVSGQTDTVGVPAPATACTIAASGSGSITGAYTAYVRFLDRDGRPSSLSPLSNSVTAASNGTITYTSVPVPTSSKVVRRQILRNTAGQTLTYYVDVDTTDVGSTSFTSTKTDTTLATQAAVPIFDQNSASLASRYGIPRADKPLITAYLDRMFLAGEVAYSGGMVEVAYGSATVQGVGTNWPQALEGRYLYLVGHDQAYQISAVATEAQTLTLAQTYKGATDKFGVYTIRSAPAERRNIYFTEAGNYEAWAPTNGLTLEETGDDVTGLMVADSFLFVLCRRHIYRLTYHLGPNTDGGIFLSAHRGCVNHRCWVYLDGYAYLLDEHGVYRFRGSGDAEQLSGPVQDLWWIDHPQGELRINWNAQKWFHAAHSRDEATIRWFVALAGSRLPRHALCYNYVTESWWVEEFPFTVGASCLSETDTTRPLLGGPSRRVFTSQGTLDGPDPKAGTTRGTVTSATLFTLTDSTASFASTRLVGSPVALVDGRGKGQVNIITAQSGTTLSVQQPWTVKPDTTSVYQIGAIPWRWRSHWMRWHNEEGNQERRLEVLFQPTPQANSLDARFYENHATAPTDWGRDWPPTSAEGDGVTTAEDDPDAEIDLSHTTGFAQLRLAGRRERYARKSDVVAVELRGFSGRDPVTVHEMTLDGAT